MALHDKYKWADFLRDNPTKKGLKRTSEEGKKAFEAASKAFLTKYLQDRESRLNTQLTKTTERRDALVGKLKEVKKTPKRRILQSRVGQKDHAMACLDKQIERTKAVAKTI